MKLPDGVDLLEEAKEGLALIEGTVASIIAIPSAMICTSYRQCP